MARTKRRPNRFEVEWITVSYRTLVRWAAAILGVGVVVGGIALGFRLEAGGDQRDVERLVAAVERDYKSARSSGAFDQLAQEAQEVETRLASARSLLDRRELEPARKAAEEARDRLRQLGGARNNRARMLQVEGEVEVKRVGGLDWQHARPGMTLGPGDLVKTASGAAAQIANLDGSTVTLRADTVLRIERSAKDRVSGKTDVAVVVDSGQLTMATNELQPPGSTSEVKTANAAAYVDPNTVVGVGVEDRGERARIDVLEGRAQVRSGNSLIAVGASERLSVTPEGLERRKLPGIPQLVAPPQYKLLLVTELDQRPLELEWESIRDARAYRIELAQTPLFTKIAQVWDKHPTNFITVGKLPVGRYYWRVSANDRDGVSGGPSPAGVFRLSDALPEGEPPPLKLVGSQPLGEGMFLFEGMTQPGVVLTIDDGSRIVKVQPGQSGDFRQLVAIQREGQQLVTVTARNSEGLERKVVQSVEVRFQ